MMVALRAADAVAGAPRTIVVTGLARGGTSYAASLCRHLGVPMGRGAPRYEHPYLQRAVLAGNWEAVEAIARAQDAHLPLWGWKLPLLVEHLPRLDVLLTRPRYVLVFKNPLSASQRKFGEGDAAGVARSLRRSLKAFRAMTDFAETTPAPCLLIDLEQALRTPLESVDRLAAFIGRPAADQALVAARVADDAGLYAAHADEGDGANVLGEDPDPLYDPAHRLGPAVRAVARRYGVYDAPLAAPAPGLQR